MAKKSATRKRLVSLVRAKVAEAAVLSKDHSGRAWVSFLDSYGHPTVAKLVRCREDGYIALGPSYTPSWDGSSVQVPDWKHPNRISTRTLKRLAKAAWSPNRPKHVLELLAECAD